MATAKRNGEWFRCAQCGHKLGRATGAWLEYQAMPAIEIKCHSCRKLNYIMVGGYNKNDGSENGRSVAERN